MLLIAAIAVLGVVVAVGTWLGSLYLLFDKPPTKMTWISAAHGIGGVVGTAILVAALRVPAGRMRCGWGPGNSVWCRAG